MAEMSDLKYISNPMLWVQMICPLKRGRRAGWPEFAYMIGDGPNLYHGNMWNPQTTDRKETFESYDAIIAAGWEVD
jgi:hypothetical protein